MGAAKCIESSQCMADTKAIRQRYDNDTTNRMRHEKESFPFPRKVSECYDRAAAACGSVAEDRAPALGLINTMSKHSLNLLLTPLNLVGSLATTILATAPDRRRRFNGNLVKHGPEKLDPATANRNRKTGTVKTFVANQRDGPTATYATHTKSSYNPRSPIGDRLGKTNPALIHVRQYSHPLTSNPCEEQ